MGRWRFFSFSDAAPDDVYTEVHEERGKKEN
jgi:hypothetical protein